jgi:hypothetical protein
MPTTRAIPKLLLSINAKEYIMLKRGTRRRSIRVLYCDEVHTEEIKPSYMMPLSFAVPWRIGGAGLTALLITLSSSGLGAVMNIGMQRGG